jgi:hypothetical protein
VVPLVRSPRAQLSGVSMNIAFECRDDIRGEPFGDPDIFRSCSLVQAHTRARPWESAPQQPAAKAAAGVLLQAPPGGQPHRSDSQATPSPFLSR